MTKNKVKVPKALLLHLYPEALASGKARWTPLTSGEGGWQGLNASELRDAAFANSDPRLA